MRKQPWGYPAGLPLYRLDSCEFLRDAGPQLRCEVDDSTFPDLRTHWLQAQRPCVQVHFFESASTPHYGASQPYVYPISATSARSGERRADSLELLRFEEAALWRVRLQHPDRGHLCQFPVLLGWPQGFFECGQFDIDSSARLAHALPLDDIPRDRRSIDVRQLNTLEVSIEVRQAMASFPKISSAIGLILPP